MKKIEVKKEGRKDAWLPEKKSLISWIKSKNFEKIHNFIQGGFGLIGADHEVDSVIEDIKKADRVAIFTDPEINIRHSMAIIKEEKLEMYDVGEIKITDLDIRD